MAAKKGQNAVHVDINAKDNYGWTPLLWAAQKGHKAVARLLADRDDIDINVKTSGGGKTPLICAAEKGHGAVAGPDLSYP